MRTLFCLTLLAGSITACQTLPDLHQRTPSIYIPTYRSPSLIAALNLPTAHTSPPNAYVHILDNPYDAYAARAVLADYAAVSLDARYYIWRNDVSGRLMLQKLWQAAERGVRVRLLLDDNNTRGLDPILIALNQHRNIEVRLFNPFLNRQWRALGYLRDFPRVNRRMHNKSLTADNVVSIIGGRNMGDEYFSHHAETTFSDMDILLSGSMVTDVSADFDRYWNSQSAYPIHLLIKTIKPQALALAQQQLTTTTPAQHTYQQTVSQTTFARSITSGSLKYLPAQVELISDDPAKALDQHPKKQHTSQQLSTALKQPKHDIYFVSPYFVPTKTGTALLKHLAQQGINITVFTNSLAATDVSAVHSGYARYRKPLLQSGVKLYEFKPEQSHPIKSDKGLTGNSTSLHAKTFIVDKKRVYVGSLNMDPRSMHLNTEMGVIIHSPKLATIMQQKLQQETQQTAYHVSLTPQQHIQWRDPQTGEISQQEPKVGIWKRTLNHILSILPIERLL